MIKKWKSVRYIQIVVIFILILFRMYIFPDIEQFFNIRFQILPIFYIEMAYWIFLGFIFALQKLFTKGRYKPNVIFILAILIAIGSIVLFFQTGFAYVVRDIICLSIGFFFIDTFKSGNVD